MWQIGLMFFLKLLQVIILLYSVFSLLHDYVEKEKVFYALYFWISAIFLMKPTKTADQFITLSVAFWLSAISIYLIFWVNHKLHVKNILKSKHIKEVIEVALVVFLIPSYPIILNSLVNSIENFVEHKYDFSLPSYYDKLKSREAEAK